MLTALSEYQARGTRFGLYWTLSLPDAVATGTWVLETRVDGEPAGVHAFRILAGSRGLAEAQSRRTRSLAELYKRGLEATLPVEGLDAGGGRVSLASGLYAAPDMILAAFEAINGARTVRVLTPDQRRLETSVVASWCLPTMSSWRSSLTPGRGAGRVLAGAGTLSLRVEIKRRGVLATAASWRAVSVTSTLR